MIEKTIQQPTFQIEQTNQNLNNPTNTIFIIDIKHSTYYQF